MLHAKAEEDEIVQHPTAFVAEERVLTVADREPPHVVDRQRLADRAGLWAADLDLAHVAHVEEAAVLADRTMLFGNAAVGEGHLPAAELGPAGVEPPMGLVDGRASCHRALRRPRSPRRARLPQPCC